MEGEPSRWVTLRFKMPGMEFELGMHPVEERAFRLREQIDCGYPEAETTRGLVGFIDDEPVGRCAVDPRNELQNLGRAPWVKRSEDRDDATAWAATCFITRAGFRRQGVSRAMTQATVAFARGGGARALEGYPMITQPGVEITWGELHVGSRGAFADAGFVEVRRPSLRRVVMRIDFD
jgi:GNAT superfamily N-acetyltransferase